jgi:hypothetical protein
MGIKGRDLVDCCLRQARLLAQSAQMAGRKTVIAILDKVEEFNEEVRLARPRTQELTHLAERV